jgi:hypothetical protein
MHSQGIERNNPAPLPHPLLLRLALQPNNLSPGGKDSTVLAHVMTTLNERYKYGLDLFLLSIDEGITGYRDDSLETVKRNQVPIC